MAEIIAHLETRRYKGLKSLENFPLEVTKHTPPRKHKPEPLWNSLKKEKAR